MSIPTRVTAAAFFVFALVSTTQGQVQAPVQVSTQAQALPADDDFNALRGPAAAGDAQAQFALGNDYIDGRGVAQDYGQAVIWYRKSAAQGYAPALNQLGYMYQNPSHTTTCTQVTAQSLAHWHKCPTERSMIQFHLAA